MLTARYACLRPSPAAGSSGPIPRAPIASDLRNHCDAIVGPRSAVERAPGGAISRPSRLRFLVADRAYHLCRCPQIWTRKACGSCFSRSASSTPAGSCATPGRRVMASSSSRNSMRCDPSDGRHPCGLQAICTWVEKCRAAHGTLDCPFSPERTRSNNSYAAGACTAR